MDTATRVQILDKNDCISHSTNTLGKESNYSPSSYGQIVGQTVFSSLGRTTCLGGGNSEFKPVKLHLKIDLVSYPARAEGLVNRINTNNSIQHYSFVYTQLNCCNANGPGDLGSLPGRVMPKTLKMVLDTSLLNTRYIRYVLRVKWSNPGKGVAPFPTPRCSSYWKGSLLVTLD